MSKETQMRLYHARKELGLCTRCGMEPEEPGQTHCEACKEKIARWRRDYQRKYRQEVDEAMMRVAKAVQNLIGPGELASSRREIRAEHKCWTCVWGRWHGDRFFCPLVGCVKEPPQASRAEEKPDAGTEEST